MKNNSITIHPQDREIKVFKMKKNGSKIINPNLQGNGASLNIKTNRKILKVFQKPICLIQLVLVKMSKISKY